MQQELHEARRTRAGRTPSAASAAQSKRGDLEISGWKCREHAGEMKGTWWLIMKIHGDQWWLPPVNVYIDVENAEILQIISELENHWFSTSMLVYPRVYQYFDDLIPVCLHFIVIIRVKVMVTIPIWWHIIDDGCWLEWDIGHKRMIFWGTLGHHVINLNQAPENQ